MRKSFAAPVATAVFALLSAAAQAAPVVVYDSLGPAVYNLPSLGYQATSTSEFGDRVAFTGGSPRTLQSATVRMSTWALQSDYPSVSLIGPNGYDHELTFNIYAAGSGASHGALLASQTISTLIPWRPEADPTCAGGTAWRADDGSCYNGMAFDVTFDFSALGLTLPDEIVFGLAFDTQSYGANPIGVPGPYNSLNFGVSAAATVGTDTDPDAVFWNTAHQPFLTSGTAGVFGEDTGWAGLVPAVQFVAVEAVPEPGSLALAAAALLGAAAIGRRRSRAASPR